MLLATLGISAARLNNLTIATDDEHVRYHLHAHSTTEFAVRVEQHFVFPLFSIYERLNLINILRLVDRNSYALNNALSFAVEP